MKIVPLFFQYSGGAFVEFYQEKDENRLHSVVNWIVDIAVVIAPSPAIWSMALEAGSR